MGSMLDGDMAMAALGVFASKIKATVEQAADTVKTTSLQLAEDVKEKSKPITDSIVENATVVKSKSIEFVGTVAEKSSEVADSVKKGAVAVAENVQGRVAPRTVKREGYLTKQVDGNKWIEYYFSIRDGTLQVLKSQSAEVTEISIALECIQRTEPLDSLVTNGKPFCFRIIIKLFDRNDTMINNWSFFGSNLFTSNKVNNQEIDVVVQAISEDEMNGWVRELNSTASGLIIQEQAKKTGEGALKLASAARSISFIDKLTSLVSAKNNEENNEENNNKPNEPQAYGKI